VVQPPSSSRTTQSQFPRTKSRQLLSTSKERGSITSLGNLCQCSVAVIVKEHPYIQMEPPVIHLFLLVRCLVLFGVSVQLHWD